jgi:dTDP-4-amino-4,6-dideoxygalactose transaminase
MSTVAQRRIPLLDLRAQFNQIREPAMAAIAKICETQELVLGATVRQFEAAMASYCGAQHAIGCASGSDALTLALMAYDIGPGDEVLTVPFTFFATAGAIAQLGAKPVFVDVEPETFNMDMEKAVRIIEASDQIRAVIPVDLYGGCADLDPLRLAAKVRGIPVIEDAAQSIGAEYQGKRAGSAADVACFSFYPTKNLGAFGDAGLLTTDDPVLAEKLMALRVHGSRRRYFHDWVGINSRLDGIQAAVLQVKLRYLDEWTAARQRHADQYRRLFAERGVPVRVPQPAAYQTRHIYNQFVITCDRRDELRAWLAEHQVGSEIYYPLSLHQQVCFSYLGYKEGDFPVSEELTGRVLALPVYPELQPEDIDYVVDRIAEFYADPPGQQLSGR